MTSQNTTLYTPFADGRTVRDIVEHSPALVSEAWCRQILQHILPSLEQQYASAAPHRIISPDTVVVLDSGEALLLPSSDGLASSNVDSAHDIHALAEVIHYAISGELVPEGPLGPRLYDNYSDQLTQTIDRCLGPNLRLRPKGLDDLRAMLGLEAGVLERALEQQAVPAPLPSASADAAEAAPAAVMDDARAEVIQEAPTMPAQEVPRTPTEPAFQEPVRPEAIAAAMTPAFNKPAVGTPLKPSSHSVPAPAPALPATAVQVAPLRKKSAVERWAMMAGAAVVLLAAASALYLHLNGDNSSDLVALSLPPQEQAARGLDAGEAVVAPAAGVAGQGPAEALQANGANALPADAAPAAVPEGAPTAALQAPARQAEAVVNGTTYKLLIKPWGTVYVNGVDRGVSPPVKRLTLGQGEHTIRIVNPNFAEHVMTVNAGTAESATIEHDFTAQAEGDR